MKTVARLLFGLLLETWGSSRWFAGPTAGGGPAPEASEPEPAPVPTEPAPAGPPPGIPHVQISVDLPEGTIVHVVVQALPRQAGSEGPAALGQAVSISRSIEVVSGATVIDLSLPEAVRLPEAVPLPGAAAPAAAPDRKRAARPDLKSRWNRLKTAAGARAWPYSLATTLFGLAGALFLLTRLIGLVDFPIYFFTDEAIQTNLAADFISNNFRDRFNEPLPTYFINGNQYNLSLSVYAQVVPYLLFGKSVFVTRLVSVLIALFGTLAVGLILRDIFELPYWWSGTLLLSLTPVWFLHSRTAFETVEATALYAVFLYYYLMYRYRAPRYLYAAMVFGALTFYTYSPAQLVMAITGVLLLISDWRYHWENRLILLRGLALAALLALPYVRFSILHPEGNSAHLKIVNSYWVQAIPLAEKLRHSFSEYLYGISPGYWFVPNQRDLVRHVMLGYGHLLRTTLPFMALGIGLALWRSLRHRRAGAYRALLFALAAAPAGGALAEVGITRVLVMVIPAALLTALGAWFCLDWLEKRGIAPNLLALGLFGALALANVALTRDALVNGPTWFTDYTLGGLQYGARQVFGAVEDYLKQSPHTRIMVTPNWANGADEVARFFMPDPLPIQMGSIEAHMFTPLPLDESMLFVMMADEYQRAVESRKFSDIRVEKTLPYPDGQPGFLFVRLRYSDNIAAILAAEKESRRQLLATEVTLDGQQVQVRYPMLDMGEIPQLFDGNLDSLIRTLEANPLVLELTFPQPRRLSGMTVRVGGTATQLTARLLTPDAPDELVFSDRVETSSEFRNMALDFGQAYAVNRLIVEVKNSHDSEPAHVHVWEITFNESSQ